MISNPVNQQEDDYYVPISCEREFEKYWQPIIDKLNLKWANFFQCGIEIEKMKFDEVIQELNEILKWVQNNMDNAQGKRMEERIRNLCKELHSIYNSSRDDIKVFIG